MVWRCRNPPQPQPQVDQAALGVAAAAEALAVAALEVRLGQQQLEVSRPGALRAKLLFHKRQLTRAILVAKELFAVQ